MRRAPLPAQSTRKSDASNSPMAARCSSMKSANRPWNCSRSCFASCRIANLNGWAVSAPCTSMCDYFCHQPRFTPGYKRTGNSAKTCSTGSMCFPSICHHCASVVATFQFWFTILYISTPREWASKSTLFPRRRWKSFRTGVGREISATGGGARSPEEPGTALQPAHARVRPKRLAKSPGEEGRPDGRCRNALIFACRLVHSDPAGFSSRHLPAGPGCMPTCRSRAAGRVRSGSAGGRARAPRRGPPGSARSPRAARR